MVVAPVGVGVSRAIRAKSENSVGADERDEVRTMIVMTDQPGDTATDLTAICSGVEEIASPGNALDMFQPTTQRQNTSGPDERL